MSYKDSIYGYELRDLYLFAYLCKEKGLTPRALKNVGLMNDFIDNLKKEVEQKEGMNW